MLRKAHTGQHRLDLYLNLVAVPRQESVFRAPVFLRQSRRIFLCHSLLQLLHTALQSIHIGKDRLHLLPNGPLEGKPAVLLLIANGKVRSAGNFPRTVIRFQFPTDDSQKGSLAGAIGAHQANTVVILYLGGDIGKNNLAAKAPTNILQRDLHHDSPFLL